MPSITLSSIVNIICFVIIIAMAQSHSVGSKVASFATKPFVQRALANPMEPSSVLSFFFGVDYHSRDNYTQVMRQGLCFKDMAELWFQGGTEYDKLCQHFAETIRKAGAGKLDWQRHRNVDNLVAEIILCDQLARNAFRGSSEAFAYDDRALEMARLLSSAYLGKAGATPLEGEIFPTYLAFVATSFMHSENLQDHEECLELIHTVKEEATEHMEGWWNYSERFALEHKEIIDRFGRYPHRNGLKNRESTPEEKAWLADSENVPEWAKSQLPK